ncbi:MAG: hypothetical protein RL172_1793 [Bacteroidota bacterium]|jgi:Gnt-I system high-affinity gluconate transporter
MSFVIVLLCIVLLVLLITWAKLNPFLSFLLVAITAGLLLGIQPGKIIGSLQKGIGDTLGSLVMVISLGAMLGKLVAESGAAQKIAMVLTNAFGVKNLHWALMITGFIIGIPLFYGVGFVLMVPLIFSIVYQYKLPAVYIGLPMLAALSVTHGFLPPHPSPTALVQQFKGSVGLTLVYGLVAAIPAIIIAGPVFSSTLKKIPSEPLETFRPRQIETGKLPGTANSFITSLLPVFLIMLAVVQQQLFPNVSPVLQQVFALTGDSSFVMLASVMIAAFTLGTGMGKSIKQVMAIYTDAIKDVGMILLIIAGAGALKQVLTDSGVSQQIGMALQSVSLHPLIMGWLIAAIIRVCVGSATVAGLTTAGIIAPLIVQANVNPNLMVLSIGAGSLMFSHVNDTGFWMFKEYFNLSVKNTFKTWTVMESIVSVVGLLAVLLLNAII